MRKEMEANRRRWDESVAHHYVSRDYDVPRFKRGRTSLHRLEIGQVGPVRGRSLLHLQCHFGMDTLSWARLGARVTGVDFSPEAIRAARRLAVECGLASRARFVESDVYALARKLRGEFDIVCTAKGVLGWLPDLRRWARVVAHFLRPGGLFYLLEDHPMVGVYRDDRPGWEFYAPYFADRPLREEYDETYATEGAKLKNKVSYTWQHTVGDVLNSLAGAGLRMEEVREYPYTFWKRFPGMRRGRDGWWHLPRDDGFVPLMWSVRARKVGP